MSLGQLNKKFDWLNDLTIRDKDTSRLDELANLYNKTKDKKYYGMTGKKFANFAQDDFGYENALKIVNKNKSMEAA